MSTETASGPTEDQVEILEYNFNKVNKHPDPTTLCLIAAEAGLSEEETQVSPGARPARPHARPSGQPRSREGEGLPHPRLPPGPLPPICQRFCPHPGSPDLHRFHRSIPASRLHPRRVCPAPQPSGSRRSCLETPRPPSCLFDFPLSPTARESTLSSRRAGSRVNGPTFVSLSRVHFPLWALSEIFRRGAVCAH
uniref:Uncharacterized protein n=1 Tax=Ovis aries TaxID=9940 RepID=A0AC11D274_SHEEP